MSRKIINVELTTSSIEKAIKQIKEIKESIRMANEDFVLESLDYILQRAKNYHTIRTYNFPNTANINSDWKIKKVLKNKNNIYYELRNTNELVALVEFGTGIVGEMQPHELAQELGYEYDENQHQLNGWTFKSEEYGWFFNFIGYEGQAFLYDAVWDYFERDEWKRIYKKHYEKYMSFIK